MFYGNPNPSTIPALGINAQASSGCGGELNTYEKANYNGHAEVGTLTFKFDKSVTDPVLDLSGLGGYVSALGQFQLSNGNWDIVGRGSFNATDIELVTDGVSFEKGASNSNLDVTNNWIKVKNRNTFTHAVLNNPNNPYIYSGQYNSPRLEPAGAGSVILRGTFKEVSLKLYHNATPWSAFPAAQYNTSRAFFTNYNDSRYGDGINGLNLVNTERIQIGNQIFTGLQNWDLFRMSLRLPKPSSIGDKVWLDENKDGIQDATEKSAAGVTVRLLDKEGKPAKDFNGNPVADQETDENGNYKFENLAAGEYTVEIVPKDGQKLTEKAKGTDNTIDSDFDSTTNKSDSITLEPNQEKTDIDAGLVEDDTYKVVYKFEPSTAEGTPDTLPKEVLDQLPDPVENKENGDKVDSPEKTTFNNVETDEGTWSFEKWDKDSVTIDKDSIGEKRTEEVTGYWKFTPKAEYKVTHEFKSGTPNKELPDEVKALLPKDQPSKKDGSTVGPTQPTQKTVKVSDGTWTFTGYDREQAVIAGKDENFVGTWEFTPKTTEYKVDYEFQPSKEPNTPSELPQGVKNQLPKPVENLEDGKSVPSPTKFTPVKDEENGGTWTFEKWDKETATIKGSDEHVTGTWKFTKDEEPQPGDYKVDYEFQPSKEPNTPSELPQGVKDQLPKPVENLEDGKSVPSPTNFTPVKDEVNGGTWTFESWDKETATIKGADEHVTGTWVFTKDEAPKTDYKVDYEFQPSKEPNTPSELPQGVKDQLPKPVENLEDGKSVPSPTNFTPVKDEVNGGTWTFESWDKETATIKGADEHVTGTWKFTKDEEPQPEEHKVTHEFKSGTKGKDLPKEVLALLPENQTGKKDGNIVVPTEPNPTKVETADGTWLFKGYDRKDATINGKDEHFVGTWEFTPKEDPQPETGSVYVKYVTEDGKVLEKVSEVVVNAEVGTKYTTEQKTFDGYEFVKMDDNSAPANGEVKKGDQHVTYVYKKTEVTPPVEETGNVYVKYVAEDGTVLEKESTVKKDAKVGEAYTTEQKTFDGYEFVKMDDNSAPANGEVKKGDQHVTYVYKKTEVTPPVGETGNVYVKYVTEDGEVLEAESAVKKDAKVGENYTTEQKTFDGYEFVKLEDGSAPANGEVKKGDQHVTYVYKKKEVTPPVEETGNVYVKYVTEDGTVLEKESTVKKDAKVGEAYTTEQKTFEGYEFVKMDDNSAPANGKVEKGDQHVTYVYKKTEVTPPVEETGNVYVKYVAEDGTVLEKESTVKKDAKVGEAYTTEQKTFDGYVFARMADDSADANGTVKKGDQTVTYVYKKKEKPVEQKGSVYVRYITEDGTVLEDYTVVKKDAPVGEHYTTDQKAFNGYVFKGMSADSASANGNVEKGDLYITYVYKPVKTPEVDPEGKKGNVYVNYVTVDGKTLQGPTTVKENARVGEAYTTQRLNFDGYEFVKMGDGSADANGNVLEGDQYVTYVYKPIETPQAKTGNVYVKYVTEDGKVLEAEKSVVTNAKVGTEYKTELKSFDDYEFVKMADGSADANGNVVEGDLHVVYVYRKKSTPKPPTPSTETGNVFVKYVTEDGTVLYEGTVKKNAKIGDKYTTEKKEFKGYEFVRMDKNSAAKNGSVTKEDQTVVYVYKKKGNTPTPTVDKVTKYVDENGKEISISTKGNNPKKDIDGYEFVKTETDKNGNTVHIYKKKDSQVIIPADKEYKVSYEFESATEGKKLPQEVLDLLPSTESGKKDGDKIKASKPSKTKVEVKDGTWEFVSYDKDEKTVDKADVKFVGKWVFKENTKKPGVSTGETTKPNKDNKPNTSTGTVSPGKTTVVPGSTTINQANKTVRGNVRTGVGSSIGALVTLAGSALALFKSKKRK